MGPFYFSATSLKVEGDENWIEGQRSQGEVRGVMKEDDQGRAEGSGDSANQSVDACAPVTSNSRGLGRRIERVTSGRVVGRGEAK